MTRRRRFQQRQDPGYVKQRCSDDMQLALVLAGLDASFLDNNLRDEDNTAVRRVR